MANKIGIILGSGLSKFTERLSSPELVYEDDSSFHKLKVFSGEINDKEIILFAGRRHFYEGYSVEKVLENVDIAKKFGISLLIITNAAGGINSHFRVSDLMLIVSHLNFLNKRIPSKNNLSLYDKDIIAKIKSFASEEKINLKYGSYCSSYGPMYETKSEIKFLTKLGIDAVGMSTIPEVLYANKNGIKTLAFSCITNILSESSATVTDHDEVVEAGKKAYSDFSKLLLKIIAKSEEL